MPFIEQKGAEWIANKGCVSCHHTAFMVWSLEAARQKGVAVDQDKLKQWSEWATDWHHFAAPTKEGAAPEREATVRGQSDAIAQLLLGHPATDASADQPKWAIEYAVDLAKGQQADGSWSPGGQLPSQKRPKRETQEVSTMWALLALDAAHVQGDSLSPPLDKARTWLGTDTVGKSTEWWAVRSMFERRLGSDKKDDHYREELLKRQRADGGWGWLCDDESDALGTGIAIFALGDDREQAARSAVVNARAFLTRTQSKDGSWAVRGTKENRKAGFEATSSFWGTCWAVIGLCATLDD